MRNGLFTVLHGVASMSVSSFIYIVLGLVIAVLLFVTQCQRSEIRLNNVEIERSGERIESLQTQLDEAVAQRDAERRRITEVARRLDDALTQFVNNSEVAHEDHEERMEELSNIENPEAVDWLCEPVPDDIRMLFGCNAADSGSSSAGGEVRSADGLDAAVH